MFPQRVRGPLARAAKSRIGPMAEALRAVPPVEPRPRAWPAVFLVVLALAAGVVIWRWAAGLPPRQVAEAYVAALARVDEPGAERLAVGSAAYAVAALKGGGVGPAQVQRVDARPVALGRGWALIEAEAELVLADGSADVRWYRLELLKKEDAWRVVDLQPVPPRLSGFGLPVPAMKAAEEAKEVFSTYLRFLSQGKYTESVRLTVGPAQTVQEQQAEMGGSPMLKEVSGFSARALWRRGKGLALLAEYEVGGRPGRVLVLMYRTGQGWRVARVSPV